MLSKIHLRHIFMLTIEIKISHGHLFHLIHLMFINPSISSNEPIEDNLFDKLNNKVSIKDF